MSNLTFIKDLGMIEINSIRKDTGKKTRKRYGLYLCDCGKEFKAMTGNVKKGSTTNCGCKRQEAIRKSLTTHGKSNHRLYKTWTDMIRRTSNPKSRIYKYYGGRGIKVCNRWLDINNFIKDMDSSYVIGLSIDRIDNDGNYEPSNCRWADRNTQSRNKRLLSVRNKSGYRGITKIKNVEKWVSRIKVSSKNIYIGRFNSKIEAALAYDNYVIKNNLEHPTNFTIKEVEYLEENKTALKTWTVEELQEIIRVYRAKIKELKNSIN